MPIVAVYQPQITTYSSIWSILMNHKEIAHWTILYDSNLFALAHGQTAQKYSKIGDTSQLPSYIYLSVILILKFSLPELDPQDLQELKYSCLQTKVLI